MEGMGVHHLPLYATPFVGRLAEITEITKRLNDPDCRLLTLVGPGGIGKTRLAIEVAKRCDPQFADGVYFIPFQPLNSPDFMVSAIADSLCFQFHPGSDPKQQLLDYLRDRCVFMILDNFEHLLAGTDLISDILATAPDVKMLVTSRHTLNIREEWVWVVEGLSCPKDNTAEKIDSHDAMQLFAQCASRVRQDFSLIREQEHVREICQLVEGLPLALELAASWTKVLLCQTMKEEIKHSFDFLTTALHNIPERHRSINAVFEQT